MQATSTESLFSSAMAFPQQERSAFLLRACGDDDARHACIEQLLGAASEAPAFVKEPSRPNPADEAIGDYRLLHELGEGGCGVVYLAEQLAPIKREVALKIIKLGMDTKAVINRFEAERQALAMMDHPNIAKVFDAGATSTGRPYFVMELVRGIKITEYCEQCRLTLEERLDLFVQLCQAIQHAHVKGIIHRDIKPSNVLVTLHDGKPIVKVIDFGIAKAIQGRLSDETVHTLVDQFIGTPAYVSPEQTEPGAFNVDTRSDIYSLGALLHELLTGSAPFDNEELMQLGLEQMRNRINRDEPVPPSKRKRTGRLESAADASSAILRCDHELDWVVLRCLEKQRERRYQTAGELIDDVERYLGNLPLAARPHTTLYTLAKFTRRHRLAFATAASIALVLSLATAVSAWHAWRALKAEGLAQEAIKSLVNVYSAADPESNYDAVDDELTLLERAERAASNDLGGYPAVQAQLLESLGSIHIRRREADRALPLLARAVEIRKELKEAPALISALTELAAAQRGIDDIKGAHSTIRAAKELARSSGLERSVAYARLLSAQAMTEKEEGRIAEALAHLDESLELRREHNDPDAARLLVSRAALLLWIDDLKGAEENARRAVQILTATRPPRHPSVMTAEFNLAAALHYQERFMESDPIFQRVLSMRREVYGHRSHAVASILPFLAESAAAQNRWEEAEINARDAVRISYELFGSTHSETAYCRTMLALVLEGRGKYDEAETEARSALEAFKHGVLSEQYIASAEYVLGEIYVSTGRWIQAEQILRDSIDHWQGGQSSRWRLARSENALGEALLRQGRVQEATRLIIDSYRELSTAPGVNPLARARARQRLAFVPHKSAIGWERTGALTAGDRKSLPEDATLSTGRP